MDKYPELSIVIPTLNSAATLGLCLESLSRQDYPREKTEIIIADGGSTDATRDIVKDKLSSLPFQILTNRLKTGEAGKAQGAKAARKEIVVFIDSDNILENKDWLKRMVKPFQDPEIVATEPLYYTYRKEDGLITRYCALLGMNDPLCYFLGNYDRYSWLGGRWTEMPVREEDAGDYLKVTLLDEKRIPTMGANGFMIRRRELTSACTDMADRSCSRDDYLFDIDIIYELLKQGKNKFAKVKTGLIHIFSGNVRTFVRKQRRRIKDYLYFSRQGARKYPWRSVDKLRLLKFAVYCLLVFPLFCQAVRGYLRKPDKAWFFHPLACEITFWVYGTGRIAGLFRREILSRERWG